VQAAEGFIFEANLAGNIDGPVPYAINRDGVLVHRGTAQV
jgi:hypothetical protein